MKRLAVFILFCSTFLHGLAQEEKLFDHLEATSIPSVNQPGYFLVKGTIPENCTIIQSKSDELTIIYASDDAKIPSGTDIYQINNNWKLAPGISSDGDKGSFIVTLRNENLISSFESKFDNSRHLANSSLLIREIRAQDLMKYSEIIFISRFQNPAEESLLSFSNLALNRVAAFQSMYPDVQGNNQIISIKERGYDPDDPDIRGRHLFDWPEITTSAHATDMATIAAGSGLLSDGSKGAAAEAGLKQASFNSLFAENETYYADVNIQNHSYGTLPEPFYGPEAASYDQSVASNPELIHVFSIGNGGLQTISSGPYAGIPGYSTLTGNFKNAKNILTVSSSDAAGNVILQNSKGPAFDGRIKPELVAYGEGGTSDAAALVSGSLASLSELYFTNYQQKPEFALMRAILIAGADEINNPGPDYTSGYGQFNMMNASDIIVDQTFQSVTGGQQILLNVPAGTSKLRIALSWLEPPSLPGDEKLLVNDIDLVLSDPQGNSIRPWILSTFPHIDSLSKPAKRGSDHLNTIELITLENPPEGTYEIQIQGPDVPAYVAWHKENEDLFAWRFPMNKSTIEAGENTTVYWDTSLTGSALVEWSANTTTWKTLGSTSIEQEYFSFTAPDTAAVAQIRLSINESTFVSTPFTISPVPETRVEFTCTDAWQISWNPILNASEYEVLGRSNNRLALITNVQTSLFNSSGYGYYDSLVSVRAMIGGLPAQRSVTFNVRRQGVGCYYAGFTGVLQPEGIDLTVRLGTVGGVNQIRTVRLNDEKTIFSSSNPSLISEFTDETPLTGTNKYQTILTLSDGTTILSEIIDFIYVPSGKVIVYPNPVLAGEFLNVYTTDPDIIFELVTLQGSVVTRIPLIAALEQIPVNISQGIYLYRIIGPSGRLISGKLIVN